MSYTWPIIGMVMAFLVLIGLILLVWYIQRRYRFGICCQRSPVYDTQAKTITIEQLQTDVFNCGSLQIQCRQGLGETCKSGKCVCLNPALTSCVDGCVSLGTDIDNCGICGKSCTGMGEICINGTCTCTTGEFCDNRCTDKQKDPLNCGTCGTICASNERCVRGECTSQVCANTDIDVYNCGECGNQCTSTDQSTPACCAGICTNLLTNLNNCGFCGNVCPTGWTCENGDCINPQTNPRHCGIGDVQCDPGSACCLGVCTNLQNTNTNCGFCGNVCDASLGLECVLGECAIPSTNPRECGLLSNINCLELYGPSGVCINDVCVDRDVDEQYCGSGQTTCTAGPNHRCCSGICKDIGTDEKNCGDCGNQCVSLLGPDAEAVCIAGLCYDLRTNNDVCGQDRVTCPAGTRCEAGICIAVPNNVQRCGFPPVSCPTSSTLCCEGICVNGSIDAYHCGSCFNECPQGEFCVNGTCTTYQTDILNCGAQGNPCLEGQLCIGSTCVTMRSTVCSADRIDCSIQRTMVSPGCCETSVGSGAYECVDLDSDSRRCGSCSNDCGPGNLCYGGVCIYPSETKNCGFSHADCTTKVGPAFRCCNFKCVNPIGDNNNCGTCGNSCDFGNGESCCGSSCTTVVQVGLGITSATCGLSCSNCALVHPIYGRCCGNTPTSATCVNIATNFFNCGSCGNACLPGQTCSGGVCA